MTNFEFRLEALLKLREADRQQRRLELAEAFHAEQILENQGRQLAQDLHEVILRSRVSAAPGRVDVDHLRDAHRYRLMLDAQRSILRQRLEQVGVEVQNRRRILAEADKDVRLLEKLRDRQLSEHEARELRRELMELDEVALQQWSRRAGANR